MAEPLEVIKTLNGLLSAFPSLSHADPDGALRAYLVALAGFELGDIAEGCRRLIAGEIPEHDGRYAPTAPQLARAARRALDDRLTAAATTSRLHPPLPPPPPPAPPPRGPASKPWWKPP